MLAKIVREFARLILEQLKIMLVSMAKSGSGRFFGQRSPALFGYAVSVCCCSTVFGFIGTLDWLFADIHQQHIEDGVTGLQHFLAW